MSGERRPEARTATDAEQERFCRELARLVAAASARRAKMAADGDRAPEAARP